MRTMRERKELILSHFNPDGYNIDNSMTPEQHLISIFKSECLHNYNIKRYNGNIQRIAKEWLLGLPSCLNLPCTYYDISSYLSKYVSDKNQHRVSDPKYQDKAYWNGLAVVISSMYKDYIKR